MASCALTIIAAPAACVRRSGRRLNVRFWQSRTIRSGYRESASSSQADICSRLVHATACLSYGRKGATAVTCAALGVILFSPKEEKPTPSSQYCAGLHPDRSIRRDDEIRGAAKSARHLLVVGATAIVRYTRRKATAVSIWANRLLERKPARLVTVAVANKMARIAWAVMARQEIYRAAPIAA
jgi:hypothetical protein